MDITSTTVPDSTQVNFDDVANAEITVTVESVTAGTAEQPVNIHTVETPGRAYRPGLSMRRVLLKAWGPETSAYVGRKITLFGDPSIRFGPTAVGGVRIKELSHIDKPLSIALTTARGKRAPFTVNPLTEPAHNPAPEPTTEPTREQVAACTDLDDLRTMWANAGPELRAQIEARKAELDTTAPVEGDEA